MKIDIWTNHVWEELVNACLLRGQTVDEGAMEVFKKCLIWHFNNLPLSKDYDHPILREFIYNDIPFPVYMMPWIRIKTVQHLMHLFY